MIETDDTENSGIIFNMELVRLEHDSVKGMPGVVYQTFWRLHAELVECPVCGESHTTFFDGATPLINRDHLGSFTGNALENFDPSTATPWEDLEEEQVIGFIEDVLNGDLHPFERIQVTFNEWHRDAADSQLDSQNTNLPWMADQEL